MINAFYKTATTRHYLFLYYPRLYRNVYFLFSFEFKKWIHFSRPSLAFFLLWYNMCCPFLQYTSHFSKCKIHNVWMMWIRILNLLWKKSWYFCKYFKNINNIKKFIMSDATSYHEITLRTRQLWNGRFSSIGWNLFLIFFVKKELVFRIVNMEEVRIVREIFLWIGKEESSANNMLPRTETSIAVLLYL